MPTTPRPGIYRHYKNQQLYLLMFVAINSSNGPDAEKPMAVYQALYPTHDGMARVFTRPLDEFDGRFTLECASYSGVVS